MSRHVGVTFRVKRRGVLHISQSSYPWKGRRLFSALCDIDEVGTERSKTGRLCKRCAKSAESIAETMAFWPNLVPEKGTTKRVRIK